MSKHHEVLIVGGGTGGLTVAARLRNAPNPPAVTIIEPSEKHYYQPLWTLVGGGVFPRETTERDQKDFIPAGATWIKDKVVSFDPDQNALTLAGGDTLTYDYLVVAPGIQINWGAIKGLTDAIGKDGVCSNYSYDTVESTWKFMREFKGGKALFTFPPTPIKCGGAPQKIMWLMEHHLQRMGRREGAEISFWTPGGRIFGVDKYAQSLERLVEERDIKTNFGQVLTEIRGGSKEAVFRAADGDTETVVKYDFIHVTPHMGAPDFVKNSPLGNADGWVEVDKGTTQHVRYENVFACGDASSLPTAKTGAAIRKQAPVLVDNLLAHKAGKPLTAQYDGYTSCPLVTGYGRLILAEFDYDGNPVESFPFDQGQERYSMYTLKAYGLPAMYWHGMLRGRV